MGEVRVRTVVSTCRGPERSHNEDHVIVGPWVGGTTMAAPLAVEAEVVSAYLVGVADGLGGHRGGEIASALVGSHLAALQTRLTDGDRIAAAVDAAHRRVLDQMTLAPELEGMGSTLAAVVITRTSLFVVNVGDSRVYEVNQGFLRQRSVDDSPPAPAGATPGGTSVLTSCLGAADVPVTPHVAELPLRPTQLLICSDGLTDVLDPEALERELVEDDHDSVVRLLAAADAAGRHDDTSIALVRVELGGDR